MNLLLVMVTGIIPILNTVERETFARLLADSKCKAKQAKRLQAEHIYIDGRIEALFSNKTRKPGIPPISSAKEQQALQRTQPNLSVWSSNPERAIHDYHRLGTTTLFTTLGVVSGKNFGQCKEHHCATEYNVFMKYIDSNTPRKLELHKISDNYATHKTKEVKQFVANHPRFKMYFTQISSLWLNLVQRWFVEITNKSFRRDDWNSLHDLTKAIYAYMREWNENPEPFRWTKKSI